jgi:predicted chitinase
MSLSTIDQLDMAGPDARYEDLIRYIDFLNERLERFEINTPNRIAAFISRLAHESTNFVHTVENLNYAWPRSSLKAISPAPRPRCDGAQWRLCWVAGRYW